MDPISSDTSCGMVTELYQDQDNKLPYNLTKDLYDLQVGLNQLKANDQLAYDQSFRQKMVDYLDNYTNDYNADVNGGNLTPSQQITLSDLNEDLKVNGLIDMPSDGPISNPNDEQGIQPFLLALLDNGKVDWICIINDAINSALGTPSA